MAIDSLLALGAQWHACLGEAAFDVYCLLIVTLSVCTDFDKIGVKRIVMTWRRTWISENRNQA